MSSTSVILKNTFSGSIEEFSTMASAAKFIKCSKGAISNLVHGRTAQFGEWVLLSSKKKNPFPDVVGMILESKSHGKFKVIQKSNSKSVFVCFLSTNYMKRLPLRDVLDGNVKDPYYPRVRGVGYIGVGQYNSKKNKEAYKCWSRMLERCYCKKWQKKKPTYIGCSVDEKWHNFQSFAKWYYENIPDMENQYFLDKDIINPGNKIYSKVNCKFLTPTESTLESNERNAKEITLINIESGEKRKVKNITEFCKKEKITAHSHLCKVIRDKKGTCKGWRLLKG